MKDSNAKNIKQKEKKIYLSSVFYLMLTNNNLFSCLHFLKNSEEVRNSRVTKSSYETELRKMTLYFELLTRKFL